MISVRKQIWNQVRDQVHKQVRNQIRRNLKMIIKEQVGPNIVSVMDIKVVNGEHRQRPTIWYQVIDLPEVAIPHHYVVTLGSLTPQVVVGNSYTILCDRIDTGKEEIKDMFHGWVWRLVVPLQKREQVIRKFDYIVKRLKETNKTLHQLQMELANDLLSFD